ncbi:hypothetical protein GGR34_003450 [Microvirga flocculans]|uniref:Uncharacterized protein n=1 Tax=Microvirga flocculans TaxID=217168 RepID=A0A7W6II46_9HYPH|nr:hypothetical protein [Microvirga flocculans]MBB4041769.1 hypothetical protein [Microvirga flocculans]
MKRALILLAVAAFASDAQAQSRPSTVAMTCSASRQLVMSRGAVVLGTGGYTYDRFVRDGSFCLVGEYTQTAFVPSLDTPQCFVGYRCKAGPRDLFGD